jgi:NAD(P)-dependent dehydrogenase (short-subunit alcohol dehydrogenase family)
MNEAKNIVVTGAGSGIGRAVASALLNRGHRVVLAGRRMETLEETVKLAGTDKQQSLIITADVTKPADVDALFTKAVQFFGRLDVLFNNAGIFGPQVPFEDLQVDDWNTVISTNLTGSFLAAQGAFRIMKQQTPQGGRIINNGSISASVPRPNSAPYTATKHAMTGLTRALSLDGRKYNIACGQIDIGNAQTDLVKGFSGGGALQANGERMIEPAMDVENVGNAVAYMVDLPLNANVQFMTLMATAMPFIGRG